MPDTYAVRPSGAIAIPPVTPGIGIVCTTLLVLRLEAFLRQASPSVPFLQASSGAASTIRMSFRPRPASRTQRKRPFVVSAPPPGWLPTAVSLPAGLSLRPFGWTLVSGPMRPVAGSLGSPPSASAVVVAAVASRTTRGRRRRFTAGMFSGPEGSERRRLPEHEAARRRIWAVRVEAQVGEALERLPDRGVRLQPGEVHPDADVRATGEGEVLLRVGARDVERVRAGEG